MTDVLLGRAAVDLVANTASFVRDMNAASAKFEQIGSRMQSVGTSLSTSITLPLLGIGGVAAKAFTDFETALTGVAKTVDAPASEIERLGERFKALSEEIPVAANELLRIAELGGQLGIATGNLEGFTETIAAIGVSTNLSTEEAATGFARLANVMGTSQDQFDRIGSTIVDLGNNLATTEREILAFAERMAGAGKIAGLTEADVLAIGGALSSVGVEAEAGGTAVQKVLLDLNDAVARGNDSLDTFARVAGMTASDFASTWRADAGTAFAAFVSGLGQAGDDATKILADLGLENARTTRAFLSLANAGPLLTDALERGSAAWEENTALSEEAARFYDRLGADFSTFANEVRNVAAELGEALAPAFASALEKGREILAWARDAIDRFSKLPPSVRTNIAAFFALAAAVGPVVVILGTLVQDLAALGLISLGGKLLGWARAFAGLALSVRSVSDALTLLKVAIGPGGWLLIGASAVAAAFLLMKRRAAEATESVADFQHRLSMLDPGGVETEVQSLTRELNNLLATVRAQGGLELANDATIARLEEVQEKLRLAGEAREEAFGPGSDELEDQAEAVRRAIQEALDAAGGLDSNFDAAASSAEDAAEALERVLRSYKTLLTQRAVEILDTRGAREARREIAKRVAELKREQEAIAEVEAMQAGVTAEFERSLDALERARDALRQMYETDAANLEAAFMGTIRAIGEAFGDLGRSVAGLVDQLVDIKVTEGADGGMGLGIGIGNPFAAIGGLFVAGIDSIISSAREREARIQRAAERVDTLLDNYVDTLAGMNRFERLEAGALGGAQEILAALFDEVFAGLPDFVREDLPDFGELTSELGFEELVEYLEQFGEDGQKAARELRRKFDEIQKELEETIAGLTDDLDVRKLEATGQEEAAAALRMRIRFEKELAEALELGDAALVALVKEVYELEKAAVAAAAAAAEAAKRQDFLTSIGDRLKRRAEEIFGDVLDFDNIALGGQVGGTWDAIRELLADGLIPREAVHEFLEDIRDIQDALLDGTITPLDAARLLEEVWRQALGVADNYADAIAEETAAKQRAAEAARAAAEAEAFRASQDLRSLQVRLLLAQGMEGEAQAMRQQIELLQAIEDGRSSEYIALLQQVQAAERAAASRQKERQELERTARAVNSVTRAFNAPQGLRLSLLRFRSLADDVPGSGAAVQTRAPSSFIQAPSADTAGPMDASTAISIENVNLTSTSGESGEELLAKLQKAATRTIRRGGADPLRRRRS